MIFEFLLPRRPISHQSKSATNRQKWKEFVRSEAQKVWGEQTVIALPCHLTLVYFCGDRPSDIDNIIKPIQDALVGLVYVDDTYVTDVDSHRRALTDAFDLIRLPPLVVSTLSEGIEFVYVRVSTSQAIENYL
ncbi:RusA family crossover junction endodeoxyribonuclease [Hymenobacter caeli]|uniref:RusA family crossover junction endodeoxyribonuclease n=1 Tax=Hymenobacter caeli TaxID=2735894 RepID=UPI00156DE706|nr:RusA family crossover junction endodeoxyribonuclease [Hymenobacter caeli]